LFHNFIRCEAAAQEKKSIVIEVGTLGYYYYLRKRKDLNKDGKASITKNLLIIGSLLYSIYFIILFTALKGNPKYHLQNLRKIKVRPIGQQIKKSKVHSIFDI